MSAITSGILNGTEPSDSVDIFVRDFGVAVSDAEVFITVDGGNVGLLRLRADQRLASALALLVSTGLCQMQGMCT